MATQWVAGRLGLAMTVLVLGGCSTTMTSSDYSARQVPVLASSAAATSGGQLPQACLAAPVQAERALMPAGCANAWNLQQMVMHPGDLRQGREPGPALVGPAVLAVERYLGVDQDGERERERERQRRLEDESSTID